MCGCEEPRSQFTLPKAQLKMVQGLEQAYSWLQKGQLSGKVQNSDDTSFGEKILLF